MPQTELHQTSLFWEPCEIEYQRKYLNNGRLKFMDSY